MSRPRKHERRETHIFVLLYLLLDYHHNFFNGIIDSTVISPSSVQFWSGYRMRGSSLNISSETGGVGGQERVSTATDVQKYGWGWYIIRQEASASASAKSCLPRTTPPFRNNQRLTPAHSLSPLAFFRRQIKKM